MDTATPRNVFTKGIYLDLHEHAVSAQSAASSKVVSGGKGCMKELLAHLHLQINLARTQLCPLACHPLHCLMEGTVPGSFMALATRMVPGNARAWLGRRHGQEMAPTSSTSSGDRERHGCEFCL